MSGSLEVLRRQKKMKLWGNGIFFSNFTLKLFVLVAQIFHPDMVIFIKRKQLRKGFISSWII